MALRGKIMKNEFKKLSNRQKIAYYKSVGNDSLADNRRAIDKNNEGQGLTWRQVKINSKNLQKLMKKRGLSQFDTTQLKKSFAKWDGQNNHKGGNVTARHAKANEKYVITQTKGESASGVFVSKKSLGNSPQERIDKGALPPSNKANQEKRVALGKNQNVISGKIAQQPSFKEQDTAHGETVVLLYKGMFDSRKVKVDFSLEDMDLSEFKGKATYEQIKAYVLEQTGLKVSSLYIAQIKKKCGLDVGENFNLPKSENARQPQCTPEKEEAIMQAFKHFGIV